MNYLLKLIKIGVHLFRDVGIASVNNGENGVFLSFKAGPPEGLVGHNQFDHLSFQLWRGDDLLGDPGYSKSSDDADMYSFMEQSIGHNTMLVDFRGSGKKDHARIDVATGSADGGFGVVCGNATQSYVVHSPLLQHVNEKKNFFFFIYF